MEVGSALGVIGVLGDLELKGDKGLEEEDWGIEETVRKAELVEEDDEDDDETEDESVEWDKGDLGSGRTSSCSPKGADSRVEEGMLHEDHIKNAKHPAPAKTNNCQSKGKYLPKTRNKTAPNASVNTLQAKAAGISSFENNEPFPNKAEMHASKNPTNIPNHMAEI